MEIDSSAEMREVGSEADLAIRYLEGRTRHSGAELIAEIRSFPVISPMLERRETRLTRPPDLTVHSLLHEDNGPNWQNWFEAARIGGCQWSGGCGSMTWRSCCRLPSRVRVSPWG